MVNLKGTYQTHPLPTNNFIQNLYQICEKLSAKSSDAKLSKYHSHEKSDKWHINDINFSSILFDLNITHNHNSFGRIFKCFCLELPVISIFSLLHIATINKNIWFRPCDIQTYVIIMCFTSLRDMITVQFAYSYLFYLLISTFLITIYLFWAQCMVECIVL